MSNATFVVATATSSKGEGVNLRLIDWIWHVRGHVALAPGQTSDEAFTALTPLFLQSGTTHEHSGNTLTFVKKNQAAQDKMSVFDGGDLTIDASGPEPTLRYHLISRALLFCFLAPLLFLAIAGVTIIIAKFDNPAKEESKKKDDKKKDAVQPMNPVDKFLGAPAPDKPKKKTPAEEKADLEKKKPSPKAAYVFAGIFAALYVVGRFLEDWLIKRLFRKRLHGA